MISNSLPIASDKISVKQCYVMAEYFDAQAAQFRLMAQEQNRKRIDQEDAENESFQARKKLLLAAQKALELVNDGVNKSTACADIATQLGLKLIWIEAHFEVAQKKQTSDLREQRTKRILSLAKKGRSIREIATIIECSKTLVANIIKQDD